MDAKQETCSFNNGAQQDKDVENVGHGIGCKEKMKEDKLKSTKEENERLRKTLEKVKNDYNSLQRRFFDIFQDEPLLKSPEKSPSSETLKEEEGHEVSLSLGLQTPTKPSKDDNNTGGSSRDKVDEELSLGLDLKFPPEIDLTETGSEKCNGVEQMKEDELGETWPPSKVLKTIKNSQKELEEVSEQNNSKRARVCVRARCDTPTMHDGCQWRKYGQKIAKGNPCPRAYYRCTVAPSCPVRKQVQRCSDDMSILITTYEGTHNHPLPVAATAMASTTSAAASILLSGSSTSEGLTSSSSAPLSSTTTLNGLNFTLYNNNNNSRTGQFNLTNSSSPAPPTITLDLTTPHHSSHFNRRFSNGFPSSSKYYSSKSLDFSNSEANAFPTAWNNTYPNYNTQSPIGSFSFGQPYAQQISYLNYLERTSQATTAPCSSSFDPQQLLTETLTKVLSSDPSFQSVVAAAISSMAGGNSTTLNAMNQVNASSLAPNLKWSDPIQGISINPVNGNGKQYTPTYSNKLPSSSSSASTSSVAAGNFLHLQPQFPISRSKSSSTPDLRDYK